MKIAIVGSRRYQNQKAVEMLVDALSIKHTIVSGGCRGVDTWAEERAKSRGMQTEIYLPEITDKMARHEVVAEYYRRNKQVVDACDCVFAFVSPDRKGGTENTIRQAMKAKKEVFIYE